MYIWVAVAAYLLLAVNAVIDKFLLGDKRIAHPATYAFAIGLVSLIVVVLIPISFSVPSLPLMFVSFASGAVFTYALLAFFTALKSGEASRVVPVQAGFVPFFTLVLAFFILGQRLGGGDLVGFLFLVGGSAVLNRKAHFKNKWAIVAAFLFALSFTLSKAIFDDLGFINGFIWTRFGMVLGALTLLSEPQARKAILNKFVSKQKAAPGEKMTEKLLILFLTGQIVGSVAGFLQNYSIAIGNVVIVNALQGVQFAFLLILTSILSLWFPRIIEEEISNRVIAEKVAGVIIISIGVVILIL